MSRMGIRRVCARTQMFGNHAPNHKPQRKMRSKKKIVEGCTLQSMSTTKKLLILEDHHMISDSTDIELDENHNFGGVAPVEHNFLSGTQPMESYNVALGSSIVAHDMQSFNIKTMPSDYPYRIGNKHKKSI